MSTGTLHLVGVGPGDPDLLTLKAAKLLARAEVVAYPSTGEDSALAFEIADQQGTVLLAQPRCELSHLYESVAAPSSFRTLQLVDFGSARGQLTGDWPNSDVDSRERTFRYALTQLRVENGRCKALDDAPAFVQVGDAVRSLKVSLTLWDPKGNQSRHERTLER